MLRWPIFLVLPLWSFITSLDEHLHYWNFWDLNIALNVDSHKAQMIIEKKLFGFTIPGEEFLFSQPFKTHVVIDDGYLFLHAKSSDDGGIRDSFRLFIYRNSIDILIRNTHLEEVLLGPDRVFYRCKTLDKLILNRLIPIYKSNQTINFKCEMYKKVGRVFLFEDIPFGFPVY